LAHAMCTDGIQQLREDQVLKLLRQVRVEYPQIHPLSQHTPEEFLCLLERRTGLLIQSGLTRHNGHSVPVYEFRHLTFQEYLAGLALVQGHYRERDKHKSLAEAIAPLAGLVEENEFEEAVDEDTAVVENWREALRLCLAACNDDDVDQALLAILHPLPDESGTDRPRAVLAALCLADEPNVSKSVAREVLQALAVQGENNDGGGDVHSSLDSAVMELVTSRWFDLLDECLLDEYFKRGSEQRSNFGGLYAMTQERKAPLQEHEFSAWLSELAMRLPDATERVAVVITLTIMQLAYHGKNCQVSGMVDNIIKQLSGSAPLAHSAAWALVWMNGGFNDSYRNEKWHPDAEQLEQLLMAAANPSCDSETLRFLSEIFRRERSPQAVDIFLLHLPNSPIKTRRAIMKALGYIGDTQATSILLATLSDVQENHIVRMEAATALGQIRDSQATDALLARLQDAQEIQHVRREAATALGRIGGTLAIDGLMANLQDSDKTIRQTILASLAQTCNDEIDRRLLTRYLDGRGTWLDPLCPITSNRIAEAANRLKKPLEEIHQRYAALAERFGLKLA